MSLFVESVLDAIEQIHESIDAAWAAYHAACARPGSSNAELKLVRQIGDIIGATNRDQLVAAEGIERGDDERMARAIGPLIFRSLARIRALEAHARLLAAT